MRRQQGLSTNSHLQTPDKSSVFITNNNTSSLLFLLATLD
jgi:hypothetical protein